MSILSGVIKAAGSVIESFEDIEAMRALRASSNDRMDNTPSAAVVIPLTCPKCGGAIQPPPGQDQCFCMYCGTPLHIDDGSRTLVYRKVDETRIREAELDDSLERMKLELDEKHRPGRIKITIMLSLIGAAMLIGGMFLGHASSDSNSPWYMVSLLGYFPLLSIIFIWTSRNSRS